MWHLEHRFNNIIDLYFFFCSWISGRLLIEAGGIGAKRCRCRRGGGCAVVRRGMAPMRGVPAT
jgi:hypothetical protein